MLYDIMHKFERLVDKDEGVKWLLIYDGQDWFLSNNGFQEKFRCALDLYDRLSKELGRLSE